MYTTPGYNKGEKRSKLKACYQSSVKEAQDL